jgi:hypothetical protein
MESEKVFTIAENNDVAVMRREIKANGNAEQALSA